MSGHHQTAARQEPEECQTHAPFTKYNHSDRVHFIELGVEGKVYNLRSSYRITGRYAKSGKYCFKEECDRDGSKSVLKGSFQHLQSSQVQGGYQLSEKCRHDGYKYVLKSKYKLDERQVLHGEYRYVERYTNERSKIILRGTYVIDGYSNQLVQHYITQDLRKIGLHGQRYVSRLRPMTSFSAVPEEYPCLQGSNLRQCGSEPSLYRLPLEYNVWMDHRRHPIRQVSHMVCRGRQAVNNALSSTIQGFQRTQPVKISSMSHQMGTDPSHGVVARVAERLQKAAGVQNTVRRMASMYQGDRERFPNPSAAAMCRSTPNLARAPLTAISPQGPPPTYNSLFHSNDSRKPRIGPKPGDLLLLQKFFGLSTPLDIAGAQRQACSASTEGITPLHQAARESRTEVVGALLRLGAPLEARDMWGYTAAHKAAAAGSVAVLRVLHGQGANLQSEGNNGYRPLHRAAVNGAMEAARWLLDHGSGVDTKASGGWTPLHLAVWWDREPVVMCLLDRGADVNARTDRGWTPLYVATSEQHADLKRLLKFYGGVLT